MPDLPSRGGGWSVDSGSLDFPCVSVKNMENWRALTTDLKNERILRSGGFQACYEIIRGVVGGLNSS
jgi:hypothetical protein